MQISKETQIMRKSQILKEHQISKETQITRKPQILKDRQISKKSKKMNPELKKKIQKKLKL